MAGRPKGTGGKAEELSQTEIKRIDKCLTGTRHELRNRAILFLGLGSGMRIAEMVGLKIKNVAPSGRLRTRIILEKHSTKSKKSRTVATSKQALGHLRAYLDTLDHPLDLNAPLFPSQKRPRQPMNTTWAVQLVKQMFEEAGVTNASSHSLRRTHANTLRRNGVDLMVIKEQLGHASLSVTQRYFTVDPLETSRAVNQLRF